MSYIYKNVFLRKIILPALKLIAFNINVRHPWVGGIKVRLNTFKHKGYWYHGKSREKLSMELFSELIKPGYNVVEVGGHIGFITLYYARLVGAHNTGRVYVFEPGTNNLPYIKYNVENNSHNESLAKIDLIESAVGEKNDAVEFYEESLTGQNNSLIKNFRGLIANQEFSYVLTNVNKKIVKLVTLDTYFNGVDIDFIKIDVEGYEWFVLQGAGEVIKINKPYIMVEVQANECEIFNYLTSLGYVLFNPQLKVFTDYTQLSSNVFCLHEDKHINMLRKLQINEK